MDGKVEWFACPLSAFGRCPQSQSIYSWKLVHAKQKCPKIAGVPLSERPLKAGFTVINLWWLGFTKAGRVLFYAMTFFSSFFFDNESPPFPFCFLSTCGVYLLPLRLIPHQWYLWPSVLSSTPASTEDFIWNISLLLHLVSHLPTIAVFLVFFYHVCTTQAQALDNQQQQQQAVTGAFAVHLEYTVRVAYCYRKLLWYNISIPTWYLVVFFLFCFVFYQHTRNSRLFTESRSSYSYHSFMHTCTHAFTHPCMHTPMHAHTHACMHVHMHTHTHAYTHAQMHACTHACAPEVRFYLSVFNIISNSIMITSFCTKLSFCCFL